MPDLPSYDALTRENQRLKAELQAEKDLSRPKSVRRGRPKILESDEVFEEILFQRCARVTPSTASRRLDWSSVTLPNSVCSQQLVEYDRIWNSWVHYAIEYPQFGEEHQRFLALLQQGLPLEQTDVPWLAVYFSVLCVRTRTMNLSQVYVVLYSDCTRRRF